MSAKNFHKGLNRKDFEKDYSYLLDRLDHMRRAEFEAEEKGEDPEEVFNSLIEFCREYADPDELFANLTYSDYWARECSCRPSREKFLEDMLYEYPQFSQKELISYLNECVDRITTKKLDL